MAAAAALILLKVIKMVVTFKATIKVQGSGTIIGGASNTFMVQQKGSSSKYYETYSGFDSKPSGTSEQYYSDGLGACYNRGRKELITGARYHPSRNLI